MNEVLVSKIFNYTSTPTKNVEGQFWFNPSTNVLSRFNGTVWKPITVSSDDVAVLTDGSKVSLTNYLNTQIAALAEGIDSKQDKLKYYSETSGDAPSATISVGIIKLEGNCVAEGVNTTASGSCSHAEGGDTIASGMSSHAEGNSTIASGNCSHAEGDRTTASGYSSHTEGQFTTASSDYQHTQGKYNIEDADDKYADIIGNGSSNTARSNAATVSWTGITWSQTDVRAGGNDQDSATHSLSNKQDKLLYYSETSGNITISAGDTNAQDKQGGTINISAGDNTSHTVPNSGGSITLNGGTPSSTGGTAIFQGGSGTQSGGGMVIANGGNSATGGNITIQAGGGIGSKGNIILGDANNLYLNSSAIGGSLIDSTISSSSLNTHIPTSKAVYDAIQTASTGLEYIKEKQGENQLNTTITAGEGNIGGSVSITSGDGEGAAGAINISTGLASGGNGNINITAGDGSEFNNGRIYLKSPVIQSNGALTIDSNLQFSENTGIIGNDISDPSIKQQSAIIVTKGNSGGIDLVFKGDTGAYPTSNQFNVNIGGSDKNNFGTTTKVSTINLGVGDYLTNINLGGSKGGGGNGGTVNIATNVINIGTTNNLNSQVNIKSAGNVIDVQPSKIQINAIQSGNSGNLVLNASDSSDELKSYIQLLGPNMGSSGWIEINSAELKLNPTSITGTAIDTTITSASTDAHLPTSKAVYALLGAMQVQSTTQKSIVMNAAQTGVQVESTNTNACRITVNPKITNTGAIYITNSSTYTGINPIYPDQLPDYTFPNLSQVYVFSDNVGDGVDLTIESYGY